MKSLIFENFSLRVLSVLAAVVVWFYVNIIVNPVTERQFEIEVQLSEKKSDCVYRQSAEKVLVVLRGGRRDIIDNYYPNPGALKAFANVGKVSADVATKVPLVLSLPRGIELVGVEPKEIEINAVQMEERMIDVNVIPTIETKPGYYVKSCEPNPKSVKIRGPKKVIGALKQLTTPIQATNVEAGYMVRQALSVTGTVVSAAENADVSITPKEVDILVNVQPYPSKQVKVEPVIRGKAAFGYSVGTVETDPKTIMIKGPADKLDGIKEIRTETIDLTNATQGISQAARLEIPVASGVQVDNRQVMVTIMLKPVFKTHKFRDVPVVPPSLPPDRYEVALDRSHVDVEINAPVLRIDELSNSKMTLEAMLMSRCIETGPVSFDLSIQGATAPVEIKPAQIKGTIRAVEKR